MKKFSVFPLIAALAVFVSCQKQQTDEERKAEVERQVQDRLAAEKLTSEKERVLQQQAELEAREKALASREAAANGSATPAVEEPLITPSSEDVVRDQADTESRSETRSTAAYGMFYEKLDSYGEWRETSDYGYVFQPHEAETSRDWRPYTEGHWVYSDAGWTWVSDEPFGWATYHYGRWVKLRRVGWVWVPGEEWAPAWVSWRSSKDYVGWAPLPPEARFDRKHGIQNWADSYYDIGPDQYSFVPSNELGAEHVRRAVVPTERNTNIVIETTNVTRITFANEMVVNEGPSYDEFRSRGQRPIERYRLRRERNFEGPPRVSGNELQVSVPALNVVTNIFRPRRVKERVTEVNVDNGWTSVSDRSAAERARTKIRAEATPPPNAPPKKFVRPTETLATTAPSTTPAPTTATTQPAATAAPAVTSSPVASASPRIHRSPTVAPTMSPSPSPAVSPSAAAATAPSPTTAISTTPRTRPSPSIPVRMTPTPPPITPAPATAPSAATEPSVKPLPTFTPVKRPSLPPRSALPTPSIAPETSDTARPPMPKDVPRHTMPPRMTPPPAITPSAATESTAKPLPTLTPMKRPPMPPRTLPSPTVAPESADTARPPMPKDLPRPTVPPRMTPPPVATTPAPATAPSIAETPAAEQRARDRKPRPGPRTETETPTPTPSTPPN